MSDDAAGPPASGAESDGERAGSAPRRPPDRIDVALRGAVAAVLAAAANAAVLTMVNVGGLVRPFRPLSYGPVIALSAVGALGAAAVYGLLVGRVEDHDRAFLLVAGVVLLGSFGPDVALLDTEPGATVPGVVVLMAMHVVVAVVCVGTITRIGD